MRTLDGAAASIETAAPLLRLRIEAPTGEVFLVELSPEKAGDLAAALALASEPSPIDPLPDDPAHEPAAEPTPSAPDAPILEIKE